jgi:hypothetical protein
VRLAPHILLAATSCLFLWMFLAAASLEQRAAAIGIAPDVRERAFDFAADWRHGMAGNSPLYMPGFFALAVAAWLWAGRRPVRRLAVEGGAVLAAALACAVVALAPDADVVVRAFVSSTGLHVPLADTATMPDLSAIAAGVHTAVAWMAFVCGCRLALGGRSWRPLLPAAGLAMALVCVRTWTVNDFTSLWIRRAADGDLTAAGSAFAVPLVACLLMAVHRRDQRSHNEANTPRTAGDAYAPPASTSADASRIPQ